MMKKEAKKFPRGISYEYLMDASEFLNASIEKVLHTLLEAFILVFIVVFLFLQNFRSTLIPAILCAGINLRVKRAKKTPFRSCFQRQNPVPESVKTCTNIHEGNHFLIIYITF